MLGPRDLSVKHLQHRLQTIDKNTHLDYTKRLTHRGVEGLTINSTLTSQQAHVTHGKHQGVSPHHEIMQFHSFI